MGEVFTTERKLITRDEPQSKIRKFQPNSKKSNNKVVPYDDKSSVNTKRQLSGQTSNTSKISRTDRQLSKKKGLVRSATERLAANLSEMNLHQNIDKNASRSFFAYFSWKTLYKVVI